MPDYYNGNENLYPASIALVDDSDEPDASHFNPGVQNLADRTAYINRRFVNGYTGGRYDPTAPIVLGDNGLKMPADARWYMLGTLYFDGSETGTGVPTPLLELDGANASMLVSSGALIRVAGGGILFQGGGWSMDATSSGSVAGEIDVSATGHIFLAGDRGIVVEGPGGTIYVQPGGQLQLARGQDIVIQDNTRPSFASSQVLSIAQPLITVGATNMTASYDSLDDAGAGHSAYIPLTDLRDGATIDNIVVRAQWTSTHTSASPAIVVLRKTDLTTGSTTIVAWSGSNTIDPSSATSTNRTFRPAAAEVINQARYRYVLQYTGESSVGAQAFTWFAPIVTMTGITQLRL